MAVINLADEVVGGVLQHAELLRGAVVAADAGAVESLRWAGALPLLMQDLGVTRLLSTHSIWHAIDTGAHALLALLQPPRAWCPHGVVDGPSDHFVDHLVLLVSGFLWEYEAQLHRLVAVGVVRRLTVCSSLSERAHECFDFGYGNPPQTMVFEVFAASIAASNAFGSRAIQTTDNAKLVTAPLPSPRKEKKTGDDTGDDWGWEDEAGGPTQEEEPVSGEEPTQRGHGTLEGEVVVVALPLVFAPLLHVKGPHSTGEPSLFVLSHPICATAFPLLLTRVLRHQQHKRQYQQQSIGATSTGTQLLPSYSHVKEVQPEHIPSEFRRTLKLVAHALGEILTQSRLDAKDSIYAIGATSLKIGHTLLKILNELQGDLTTHTLQSHQAAAIVLVDRTSDLASPCSFGVSLLDRVLALLPPSPYDHEGSHHSQTNRTGLHVTEVFPLHGCEPSPLSVSLPIDPGQITQYAPSPFVSAVKWKGGATLCHPRAPHAFRSLAFRPAKLALRDLDKRLQEVEKELQAARKISRSASAASRKPGEKSPSARGRDVVVRRIGNILEAGEPTSLEHSALIELGLIVLETLERMEAVQQRWDACRERVARHVQLRKQGAGEWIIPELVDTVQRQFLAAKTPVIKSNAAETPPPRPMAFHELLTLLVHAYALSSGSPPIEEYTLQMIRNVVSECVLEAAVKDPKAIEGLYPELLADLEGYVRSRRNSAGNDDKATTGANDGDDEEEWGWDDPQSPRRGAKAYGFKAEDDEDERGQAKAIVETHMERIISPLKECAQLFAKQHDHEYQSAAATAETPRSLVAQVCSALTTVDSSSKNSIAEMEHIVDASEQLTRAGIDLLKSGFSRFGFGGASALGGGSALSSAMGDAKILVVFVVGGITFEEVQEVATALEGNTEYQVILGGTTITNSGIVLENLFG